MAFLPYHCCWALRNAGILPHQPTQQFLSGGWAQEEPFTRHLVILERVLSTFMPPCLCSCCDFCPEHPLSTSPPGKILCIFQIQLKCQPSLGSLSTSLLPITTNSFCFVNASLLLWYYRITGLKCSNCSAYATGPNSHSLCY